MTYRWELMQGHRTYLQPSVKHRRKGVSCSDNTAYSSVLVRGQSVGDKARNK